MASEKPSDKASKSRNDEQKQPARLCFHFIVACRYTFQESLKRNRDIPCVLKASVHRSAYSAHSHSLAYREAPTAHAACHSNHAPNKGSLPDVAPADPRIGVKQFLSESPDEPTKSSDSSARKRGKFSSGIAVGINAIEHITIKVKITAPKPDVVILRKPPQISTIRTCPVVVEPGLGIPFPAGEQEAVAEGGVGNGCA